MNLHQLVVLGLTITFSGKVQAWSYQGQENWSGFCTGKRQSPIAIIKADAIEKHYAAFQFNGYEKRLPATLSNSGHSVFINVTHDSSLGPSISAGGLSGKYILSGIHFHWPAEHVLDHQRYPLEGHFVHFAEKYGNITNALNYDDGIAVLATFYKVSSYKNEGFKTIIDSIPDISEHSAMTTALTEPIDVKHFLPSNIKSFYRYHGSLTTPNCNEVIIWTLFATPSHISEIQLKQLTHVWAKHKLIQKNYRTLQDLNGREVYLNSK